MQYRKVWSVNPFTPTYTHAVRATHACTSSRIHQGQHQRQHHQPASRDPHKGSRGRYEVVPYYKRSRHFSSVRTLVRLDEIVTSDDLLMTC